MRSTIYALASGRPPAAIAIIRVSGPVAHHAGHTLTNAALPEPRQAALRSLQSADGSLLDQALVLRFDGPASATGEDVVEFHCHGGRAVVQAVLAELGTIAGLREAEPGEFTRRAFENGRIDLTEAEGLADLLEAETEAQRRAALASADGALRRQIESWQARLLTMSARAEAAIDYVEEDGLGDDAELAADCRQLAAELRQWLEKPRMETLRDGLSVVLAGPPNVGKSSLLNALAGSEKAIVTAFPGTTRDRVEVPVTLEGLPIKLMDTAGIRETDDEVERIGVGKSWSAIATADVLLWMGSPGEAPRSENLLLLHPRSDIAGREQAPEGTFAVSSVTGEGLDDLVRIIGRLARAAIPAELDMAINSRQASLIQKAADALDHAGQTSDLVLIAEGARTARSMFNQVTGRSGVEDLLDALFGRFCLGK